MKKNIVPQVEYDGLGFPVMLLNFPCIEVRGIQVPNIDYNELQRNVLLILCRQQQPFTGNEVRFIRQYLQMTYMQFAQRFGVTHASVIHWEKSGNEYARIQPTTELCIRLCVLDLLHAKNKLFRETFRNFNYSKSLGRKKRSAHHITLDKTQLKTNF